MEALLLSFGTAVPRSSMVAASIKYTVYGNVRAKIQNKKGVPSDRQRLIFEGKQFEDVHMLVNCAIQEGSIQEEVQLVDYDGFFDWKALDNRERLIAGTGTHSMLEKTVCKVDAALWRPRLYHRSLSGAVRQLLEDLQTHAGKEAVAISRRYKRASANSEDYIVQCQVMPQEQTLPPFMLKRDCAESLTVFLGKSKGKHRNG